MPMPIPMPMPILMLRCSARSVKAVTVLDCVGALAFLFVATVIGYYGGAFFVNVLARGTPSFALTDGGIILPCNVAIGLKVGACLFGAFLALAVFRPGSKTS